MFKDRGEYATGRDFARPASQIGDAGKKCQYRLVTNCFRLMMSSNGSIGHYHYAIAPPPRNGAEEKWVLQTIWPELTQSLGTFVVRCSRHIFSPTSLSEELRLSVPADTARGYEARTVRVYPFRLYSAEQFNSGEVGEAEVVALHAIHKLAESLMHRRVGRLYFNSYDTTDAKAQLTIFTGFYASLNPMCHAGGNWPQLQLDVAVRAVHKRNIIDSLGVDEPMMLDDSEVKSEWIRRCVGVSVVTDYNHRVYQIKAVHFDKSPGTTFSMYERDRRASTSVTYEHYYRSYYMKDITDPRQPLLEAVPEKESEQVFLVPELCSFTGFSDEMRKDKNLMVEALKQSKVSPVERLGAIQEIAGEMAAKAAGEVGSSTLSSCAQCLHDWKIRLSSNPIEVEARSFEPLEVSFGVDKKYTIEEGGSFNRFMRNGLQCPTRFDDWLFIYPESDVPVLDIWLRSLRDIAQVAFSMKMSDPVRIVCTNQRDELERVLEDRLRPTTQLVLLLTPQKDCRRVYQRFKQLTCCKFPCITQVVKSETVRKRQSIAAILSRIVLQINAKFCGPLWHVELRDAITWPFFEVPTMALGISVYRSWAGERFVGFAASLDTNCSEYYSAASALEDEPSACARGLSLRLQDFLREALLRFARRNGGLLPEHLLVYRASVRQEDWPVVRATEVEALRAVLGAVGRAGRSGETYEPHLTFIAVSQRTGVRLFCCGPGQSGAKNPEPGTVVDSPAICRTDVPNFFLVNQAVGKGTASPTHYAVLYDTASLPPNVLQNLSYRLSFLYYNFTGSVKMPAPAQYAKKIAHLVGTAVRKDPHKRLLCTFFYL